MKTIEELNAKLAEAEAEATRLWKAYKFLEAERKNVTNPVEVAKLCWHAADEEHRKLALAIKLLTE